MHQPSPRRPRVASGPPVGHRRAPAPGTLSDRPTTPRRTRTPRPTPTAAPHPVTPGQALTPPGGAV